MAEVEILESFEFPETLIFDHFLDIFVLGFSREAWSHLSVTVLDCSFLKSWEPLSVAVWLTPAPQAPGVWIYPERRRGGP